MNVVDDELTCCNADECIERREVRREMGKDGACIYINSWHSGENFRQHVAEVPRKTQRTFSDLAVASTNGGQGPNKRRLSKVRFHVTLQLLNWRKG